MYIVFISQKVETYNPKPILPLLLIPEWPFQPLNSKGLAFYAKKINAILHKMSHLGFPNFRSIF